MFDRAEPDAWFILAEAHFNLRGVTDSKTKYWYVLSKFDPPTLRKLSTFLQSPRGSDPYQELRQMLCQTYEPPMEQKIDAFLGLAEMGDDRPSEFGLEIQRLTPKASMDDLRKRVFVRCLPKAIRSAITGSLEGEFQAVVRAADKAWTAAASKGTLSSARVAAVSRGPGPSSRGNKRGRRQRGAQHRAPQMTNLTLCSFHKKFGDTARKCAQGCSRWGEERQRDSQPARVFQVEETLDGEDELVGVASENL